MVMKNFYVYRWQFPLILAYAVTIHKCQGLSLDCAIVGHVQSWESLDEARSEAVTFPHLSHRRSERRMGRE